MGQKKLIRDIYEFSRILKEFNIEGPVKKVRMVWSGLPTANVENACGARQLSDMSKAEAEELLQLVMGSDQVTVKDMHYKDHKWAVAIVLNENTDHAVSIALDANTDRESMGVVHIHMGYVKSFNGYTHTEDCDMVSQFMWFIRKGFKVFTRNHKIKRRKIKAQ